MSQGKCIYCRKEFAPMNCSICKQVYITCKTNIEPCLNCDEKNSM